MKMICANCEHNDGMVYTSNPPMYKCTITGEYYHGFHECEVEFVPVKRGRWKRCDFSAPSGGYTMYQCSVCACLYYEPSHYCPNCGSRMDLDEVTE